MSTERKDWMGGEWTLQDYKSNPALEGKYQNVNFVRQIAMLQPIVIPLTAFVDPVEGMLHLPMWSDDKGRDLTPQQFLKNMNSANVTSHKSRYEATNLGYPLIVWKDRDTNKFQLIDGLHRVVKAFNLGHKWIMAYEITEAHLASFPRSPCNDSEVDEPDLPSESAAGRKSRSRKKTAKSQSKIAQTPTTGESEIAPMPTKTAKSANKRNRSSKTKRNSANVQRAPKRAKKE